VSKIESNVTLGLAAADQQIALGRRLDWVRPVDDGAGNQPRLAVRRTVPRRAEVLQPVDDAQLIEFAYYLARLR
jgi:hypothetical protein